MSAPLVGAYVSPRGVVAVVCRRVRGGVEAQREIDAPQLLATADEAASFLARTLKDEGLQGARLCLVIRGFGAAHHVLQMPAADEAILRPVVERELRRLEPELSEPVTNFVSFPAETAGRAQLFAAAIPSALSTALMRELSPLRIRLEHLTVGPQVVRRLYDEMDGSEKCTAVVLTLPDGPMLAFFIDGEMRLVVEPPGDESLDVAALGEEAELGTLYVRQQFRGAEVVRVLAILGDHEAEATSVISERLGLPVQRLADRAGSAAALLALGVVLDAFGESPLSLGGASFVREQQHRPRPLVVRMAYGLAAAVVIWLSIEIVALALTQRELRSLRLSLEANDVAYARLRDVATLRQSGLQSVTALADVRLDQLSLRHDLAALRATAQPGVVFDSVSYVRRRDGWQASVSGVCQGRTNAQAVQLLHAFYQSLPARLSAKDLSLDLLDYGDTTGPPTIHFRISYSSPTPAARGP